MEKTVWFSLTIDIGFAILQNFHQFTYVLMLIDVKAKLDVYWETQKKDHYLKKKIPPAK